MGRENWDIVTVRDLVSQGVIKRPMDGNHGEIHPKAKDFTRNGIPFITAADVVNGRVDLLNCNHISCSQAQTLRKGFAKTGDVLLTHKATLGRTAIVPALSTPYIVLTPQVTYYRILDKSRLDARYLRYYFESKQFQDALLAHSTGSTRHYISITRQYPLPILLPPLSTQRRIAHILGTLDDKIELNRRMNRTLEAMAAAIFKSWFIDFDPVRAKAAGRDPLPASAGQAGGLPKEIADLFPDSFQDSELGPIPEGWEVGTLGDVAENPRRSIKPDEVPPATPYIGLQDMPRRCIALDTWGRADEVGSQKSRFNTGDILFGKLRPYFHKVGVAPVDGVCSTDILVIVPKSEHWRSYVLSVVSSKEFVDYTDSHSAGTKMPRTNWKDMSRYPLAIPPVELAQAFQDCVADFHNRILLSIHQNRHLAALRDTLLPKLLSGEIDLTEAETIAEEV